MYVYYGVTDDGIHGAWRKLVDAETGQEPEDAQEVETRDVREPAEMQIYQLPAPVPSPEQSAEPALTEEQEPGPVSSEMETAAPFQPSLEEQAWLNWQPEELESEPPAPTGASVTEEEEIVPAHEATMEEMEQSTKEVYSAPQPEPEPEPNPSPAPPAPKSRAQEWREILDRAISEARAAQQAARTRGDDLPPSAPSTNPESAPPEWDQSGTERQGGLESRASDVNRMTRGEDLPGDELSDSEDADTTGTP
jgi:hypothetical protein